MQIGGGVFWASGHEWTFVMGGWGWLAVCGGLFWVCGGQWTCFIGGWG